MVFNKSNIDINLICDQMLDCIYNLDNFCQNMNELEKLEYLKKCAQEGFKSYIGSFYELLKDYLTYCNTVMDIPITGKSYKEYLELCIKENLLPQDSLYFIIALSSIRNKFSHGYEVPPFEDVLDFYKNNSQKFLSIVTLAKSKYNQK
ncbi:hypothetical protein [Romboutsia sp.]|uniref:hypothetical protein n=1 Tax=Romboutsia sp. TaxID=1965302 RepID=UPI003F2F5884